MDLIHIMQFGYAIMIATFILMIWVSIAESIDLGARKACRFNSLCTCTYPSSSNNDLGSVTCKDVHLARIPEELNENDVYELHLENNNLWHLEPKFVHKSAKYLVVRNNPLYIIPDKTFYDNVEHLELSYCGLTEVPYRALTNLEHLTLLDLTGNNIREILSDHWKGFKDSLEKLILAENSITQIRMNTFSNLRTVKLIDLSGNNIWELEPLLFFQGTPQLLHLDLSDNQLSSVPYQGLNPLKNLKVLDLSYNRIHDLLPPPDAGINNKLDFKLDILRLEYNQIDVLENSSFGYFNDINEVYLDGNIISMIETSAFRQAKIRKLYLRTCGLSNFLPTTFTGLEGQLEVLDLTGNNINSFPKDIFKRFFSIKEFIIADNLVTNQIDILSPFESTLDHLDLSGSKNSPVNIQDLKRIPQLRKLTLSRLSDPNIGPSDFENFGAHLEEIKVTFANLQSIKSNAFRHLRGLKFIDFSDNNIGTIENNAFFDVAHSLEHLCLAHAFSSSFSNVPSDGIKVLTKLKTLDLSNNKFRTLKEDTFYSMHDIRVLELHDNLLEVLHRGTFQGNIHTNLEQIYLSFNDLRTISQKTFDELPRLQQIHLDDNKIESIDPLAFSSVTELKYLNLKGNKILSVGSKAFHKLLHLEYLDMSFNKISNLDFSWFDDETGRLSVSLFQLNVSHNNLKELLSNLGGSETRRIGVLDLSFNNIQNISEGFFEPVNSSLKRLHLGHNQIMNATGKVFGAMKYLQWLDLSWNSIFEMEFDMFDRSRRMDLQVLDVSHNKISSINNGVFQNLNQLQIVDMSHNRLRTLPKELFKRTALEKLDLSHNMLSKIPWNSFSDCGRTLAELDLSWNSISSLSFETMQFEKLHFLDISYNQLAQIDISRSFNVMPRMVYLDLSHNTQLSFESNSNKSQEYDSLLHLKIDNVSLIQVPLSKLPFSKLATLSLANNQLSNIPNEMVMKMPNLQSLNVNYNSITSIPLQLQSFEELRFLSMMSNPITTLTNTSLTNLILEELDMRNFDLTTFQMGVFCCKMCSLRTLRMNLYTGLKTSFNITSLLQWSFGLRNLEIHVDRHSDSDLSKEMVGDLPPKIRNITFSGRGLKKLGPTILKGVQFPKLRINLRNTSIIKVSEDLFKNIDRARNITVDVRNNPELTTLMNPSTTSQPNRYKETFLMDLKIIGNRWDCDCDLGWIEFWQRRYRQFICPAINPTTTFDIDDFENTCRHTPDELRMAICVNKNNNSIAEVLKTDLECGWSSAPVIRSLNFLFVGFVATTVHFLV
ncbi:chaoptin isoform X2 [Anthonomus grandis grandis]|uniref:chaoptin isoform X2 n=1 Tax=Anthonomus grandis grandis TaxID=2921223 RepID=UPI002166406C|nr:chaoptin isoform X2 [Anthonomus grandis grandis]